MMDFVSTMMDFVLKMVILMQISRRMFGEATDKVKVQDAELKGKLVEAKTLKRQEMAKQKQSTPVSGQLRNPPPTPTTV